MPASNSDRSRRRDIVIAAVVTASVLGGGLLILQRWIADTRFVAMILVGGWFLIVALGAFAYARSRPDLRAPMLGTIAAIAIATVAIGYWTGFRKTEVDEMVAVASAEASASERAAALAPATGTVTTEMASRKAEPRPAESTQPVSLATGVIEGQDGHSATGKASLIRQPNGERVLTLTNLDSDPGPDVDVYLSTSIAGIDDAIRIDDLKGSVGNQQYDLPDDADLNRYDSLVLWCAPFTTRIATAGFG